MRDTGPGGRPGGVRDVGVMQGEQRVPGLVSPEGLARRLARAGEDSGGEIDGILGSERA